MADKRIWKYSLSAVGAIKTPGTPVFVHVGIDPNGEACVWAEVHPGELTTEWFLTVFGTGQLITPGSGRYVGTFVDGSLVWHVYARLA